MTARQPYPQTPARPVPPAPGLTGLNQLPISNRLGSYRTTIMFWGYVGPEYWRNYLHSHSFHEVHWAFQGRGSYRVGDRVHAIRAGDVFLARSGEPHEIVSSRGDPMGFYYWAFSLDRSGPAAPRPVPIDALLDAYARSTRSVLPGVPSLPATLSLLAEEARNRSTGYPLVIEGLVAKLLLDTARATVADEPIPVEAVDPPARTDAEAVVANACRYIRDNLARPIAVRDVAAQVYCSERHLARLFRQVRRTTVLDCITGLRMEAASHLLLNTAWPVKRVAAAVGYPDVRYFTTRFGRQAGTTPAAFRRAGGTVMLANA